MPISPKERPLRAGWSAAAAVLVAAALSACGQDGESKEAAFEKESASTPANLGLESGSPIPLEGAESAGVLVAVDPEFEERPFYKQFGSLPFGSEHFWTTELRNEGTEPVLLRSGQEACGCTKFVDFTITDADGNTIDDPERPGRAQSFGSVSPETPAVIPAGGTIALRAKLITSYSKVNQQKLALMRLTTDSQAKPYLTIEVGFRPTRSFIFAPDRANLLNSPFSSGKSERIKILVDTAGDPERVVDVLSTPEGVDAELVIQEFAGETIWYVDVSVPPLSPPGPIRGNVVLRTTDTEGNGTDGRLELPLIAEVVPDVIPSPNLASFRTFDLGKGTTFTGRLTALVPGARVLVKGARFENENPALFSATLTPIKPFDDGSAIEWQYQATIAPGHPEGYVNGEIVFELGEAIGGLREEAVQNEVRVRMSGVARPPKPDK